MYRYMYCVEYCSTKTAKDLNPFEVLTIFGLNLLFNLHVQNKIIIILKHLI